MQYAIENPRVGGSIPSLATIINLDTKIQLLMWLSIEQNTQSACRKLKTPSYKLVLAKLDFTSSKESFIDLGLVLEPHHLFWI